LLKKANDLHFKKEITKMYEMFYLFGTIIMRFGKIDFRMGSLTKTERKRKTKRIRRKRRRKRKRTARMRPCRRPTKGQPWQRTQPKPELQRKNLQQLPILKHPKNQQLKNQLLRNQLLRSQPPKNQQPKSLRQKSKFKAKINEDDSRTFQGVFSTIVLQNISHNHFTINVNYLIIKKDANNISPSNDRSRLIRN
jgi:hypothetical protein